MLYGVAAVDAGPSHNGAANMDVTQFEWFGYITPAGPAAATT